MARAKTLARRGAAHWRGSLFIAVVGAAWTLLASRGGPATFKSESVLRFKDGGAALAHGGSPGEGGLRGLPTLTERLLSTDRLRRIIQDEKLYPATTASRGVESAVEEMREHVTLREREGRAFVIAFDGDDRETARKVTQRLADSLIDDLSKARAPVVAAPAEVVTAEMARASELRERADEELAAFLLAHPALPGETGVAAATTKVPGAPPRTVNVGLDVDRDLVALQRQRAEAEDVARAAAGLPPSTQRAQRERVESRARAWQEAASRAADAQIDFAEKRARYTDQHPDYIASRAAADAAGRTLQERDAELSKAKAAATAAGRPWEPPPGVAASLRQRIRDLDGQIARRQGELAARRAAPPPATKGEGPRPLAPQTEWDRLLGACRDARAAIDDARRRLEGAAPSASDGAAGPLEEVVIAEAAYLPSRPVGGGRATGALTGLALTALLSLAYAFGRVAFSDVLLDADDVAALKVLPVLGVLAKLPAAPSAPDRSTPGGPRQPYAPSTKERSPISRPRGAPDGP